MDLVYPQGSASETPRAHADREELAERIARAVPADGTAEPLQGLHLNRVSTPAEPLHYRLQEARRLMLGEPLGAAGAGYRVGYEDASPFSQEYQQRFGQPRVPAKQVDATWSGGARRRGERGPASESGSPGSCDECDDGANPRRPLRGSPEHAMGRLARMFTTSKEAA